MTQRYTLETDDLGPSMEPDPEGRWVLWDDVAPAEPEPEVAYVNNYIEGRDAAIRESLLAHFGDMVGRQAAADTIDAALRDALAEPLDTAMEDLT